MGVAKSSGFQLGITTRWSQKTDWWSLDHSLLDIATNTGRYLLHTRQNLRPLNTRSLLCTEGGPSRRLRSLKPDWPLNPYSRKNQCGLYYVFYFCIILCVKELFTTEEDWNNTVEINLVSKQIQSGFGALLHLLTYHFMGCFQ